MRETMKNSLSELMDFANGKDNDIEVRTYSFKKAPEYTGNEIKRLREKAKISRAVFADIFSVSLRTVEKWEIDGAKPNGSAKRLMQLLDNNPEELIKEIKEVSMG